MQKAKRTHKTVGSPIPKEIELMDKVAVKLEVLADKINENDAVEFTEQVRPILDWSNEIRSQIREIQGWLILDMPDVAKKVDDDLKVIISGANLTDARGKEYIQNFAYSCSKTFRVMNSNAFDPIRQDRIVIKEKIKELARTFRQIIQKARDKMTTESTTEKEQKETAAKGRKIWIWLKKHPHSYGLIGGAIFPILFFILGLLKVQWRSCCWGTAVISLLVLILSLLGGRSSR